MARNSIHGNQLESLLVRTMALLCVRNTALENIHAGRGPVTRTGDYSDVTVIDADGQRIPWPEVSHFGDDVMRELMREVVNKLYTFRVCSREPGFLDRLSIWIKDASRWDEPKIVESFLPALHVELEATLAPLFVAEECRFAFAPHPELVDDEYCRIHLFLRDKNGSEWSVGTDLMTCDLISGQLLADLLNDRLGLPVAACSAFAEHVMATNPTGRRQGESSG